MNVHVGCVKLKDARLLIHSTCVEIEESRVFSRNSKGAIPLGTCLETEHMNKILSKIATIIKYCNPREITVLTMDGSPHCIQLHFAVEQAKRISGFKGEVKYVVVEHGKEQYISSEAVWAARHLSYIQGVLKTHRK